VYGWSEADKGLTVLYKSALRAGALVRFWPKVNIRVIEVAPHNKAIQADA